MSQNLENPINKPLQTFSNETKYQLLINKGEKAGTKNLKNHLNFLSISSQLMVSMKIENRNPTEIRRVLIVFDDIIADMESNKKPKPIITTLFIRGKNLYMSLVYISQS